MGNGKKRPEKVKFTHMFADQFGVSEEILGMQVKTPAQLGKYVSLVLNSLGTPDVSYVIHFILF